MARRRHQPLLISSRLLKPMLWQWFRSGRTERATGSVQSQGPSLKPPAPAPDPIEPAGRGLGVVWRSMINRQRNFFESRFNDTL